MGVRQLRRKAGCTVLIRGCADGAAALFVAAAALAVAVEPEPGWLSGLGWLDCVRKALLPCPDLGEKNRVRETKCAVAIKVAGGVPAHAWRQLLLPRPSLRDEYGVGQAEVAVAIKVWGGHARVCRRRGPGRGVAGRPMTTSFTP